ncbi:unnamed protein product [Sphenostylis stenocarpa]|uniref:Uncharacterized protein n=1 Tax=Sphenostylis stenocarpa TaxID=92480 RepID=A0AA86SIC8_9FABA|nr:unnamed protein product [Sphenostylis stenocarpa]
MAGIASGISTLALGSGDARRRSLLPQATPDTNTTDNNTDTNTNTNTTDNTENSETCEIYGYVNSAQQEIKGLTNQTGYVKGNANGVINFGTLTTSASRAAQP